MMLFGSLILAAVLGQQDPTLPVSPDDGLTARTWLRAKMPDGRVESIFGWREGNQICWYPEEQPSDPRVAKAPRKAINYGIDVPELRQGTRTVRASDPETLKLITQDTTKKPADPTCPAITPAPLKKAERELQDMAMLTVAALLMIGGLAIVVLSGRRYTPR